LGNALNGVPEESEGPINDSRYGNPDDVAAEEKEEIAEKVIDAMCQDDQAAEPEVNNDKPAEPEVNNDKPVEPVEKKDAVEDEKPADVPAEGEGEGVENGDDEEEEDVDEEGEDVEQENGEKIDETKAADEAEAEEISNLEIAWEMFELAKLVYTKNFDNDPILKNKRIAECLVKLGEISIEQELYQQALNDIKESIRMQEENKTPDRDERMLAESYYQFGLAYQFSEQFEVAGEQYQKSINILQLRIDKLKCAIEQANDDFERNSNKDEITELEAILPEIVSKLEEIKEQGEQSLKLIKEAKECFINKINAEEELNQGKTNGGEVKDITSLVKSKRKNESSSQVDEVDSDETAIKKTKVDEQAE
jgi:nuclear autoantigenic sperm protein